MHEEFDFTIDWDLDLSMYYLYKIENRKEYYLKDIDDGQVVWTAQLRKAIEFGSEDEVNQFKDQFLPGRNDFSLTRR